MPWRGTILFVIAAGGLVYVIASASGGVPSPQAIVMVMFGLVGVFGAVRMTRNGRSTASDGPSPRPSDSVRELRRMTTDRRPALPDRPKEPLRTIEVYPWPEEEGGERTGDESLIRRMTERLGPNLGSATPAARASRREFLSQLVREGEVLRALGRLLKVDLVPYANELSRGLAAARENRVDECAIILQLANERLRTQVQAALTTQMSGGRSTSPFERR